MASRRFNVIFEDGAEYETTICGGGGICIKTDVGGKILELGHYQTLDVLEILDRIRDELKAADKKYNNPIVQIEEDERMQLNESEICDVMEATIEKFMDNRNAFGDWSDEEKYELKRFLQAFCHTLRFDLVDAETWKLDKMAKAVKE